MLHGHLWKGVRNEMNPITTKNTINAAIAEVDKELLAKQKPPTSAQQLLNGCNAKMQLVMEEFMGRCRLRPVRPDMSQAIEELFSLCRDKFKDWDRDDLLALSSYVLATTLANELRQRGKI